MWREGEEQKNQARTGNVSDTVCRHVDDGLHGASCVRRKRGVQQLKSGAKEGVHEHPVAGAHQEHCPQPGHQRPEQTGNEQGGR
jgi:hypothetical protein